MGVKESLTGVPFTGEVWGRREFWPHPLFRWGRRSQGRRADRRG